MPHARIGPALVFEPMNSHRWQDWFARVDVQLHALQGEEPLPLATYTVATAPTASDHTGHVIYVTNGDSGSPCIAVSNGTSWLRISLGAAISA